MSSLKDPAVIQPEHTELGGPTNKPAIIFRCPTTSDAVKVHDLVAASPPLDTNSLYCNLLQCTHFSDTCIVAELDGKIVGWVSGYRPPRDPSTIFVWQVVVHEQARGCGLGAGLLSALLALPAAAGATQLKTTITPSNLTSRALFTRFAQQHACDVTMHPWFDSVAHFECRHESETLFSIGPLDQRPPTNEKRN